MLNKDRITDLVNMIITEENEAFKSNDIFIVDVKVSVDNKVSVNIDSRDGVNISDCAIISRKIEGEFDREEEDFELTVSSAGLDQPFKVLKQYEKNIGKQIKILSTDGKRYKGELTSVEGNKIELVQIKNNKKQKNKTSEQILNFDLSDIKEAKVVITF